MADLSVPVELKTRAAGTAERLKALDVSLRSYDLTTERYPSVTVFATGSLGRREVGPHSDLDVFILDLKGEDDGLKNLDRIELLARLIEVGRATDFRPFSRDGAFLQVHRIGDVVRFLGTPDDEHLNVFTARMLLLLESVCLLGATRYDEAVEEVLGLYWRDAKDQERGFRPVFLMNDIVRYWKAMCLAYEAERTSGRLDQPEDRRLAVLKLRFNRAWLCFNGLAYLLSGVSDGHVTVSHARQLVELSPVDRMVEVANRKDAARSEVQALLDLYAKFLEFSAGEKPETLEKLKDEETWGEMKKAGEAFGDTLWRLLLSLSEPTGLTRYLVI